MGLSNPALAALVDLARDPNGHHLPDDGTALDQIVDLAIRHRIPGRVADALQAAGRDLPEALSYALAVTRAAHLRSLRSLDRAGAALDGVGVPWAVVKGPVLATRWHDDATARPYDDLDLLVAPGSLRDAVEALRGAGFEHRNRNWEGFRRLGVGEVPLDDGTTVIDLHWHLIGLEHNRVDFRLITEEVLDRSIDVRLGQRRVRTLDDPDTLVHLCIHHALAGARRLVQLHDVHLVASAVPAEEGGARLSRARALRTASIVLDRAARVFGPIDPAHVTPGSLDQRAWIGMNRVADRAWDRLHSGGASAFPGAFAAAGRATLPSTARVLGGQLVHATRVRLGLGTVVSDEGPLDWNHHAGSEAERERYFADVAAGRYGR